MEPTSAVPLMTGVLSLVRAALVIAGPEGATVSTMKERGAASELRLPVESVAVAVTE